MTDRIHSLIVVLEKDIREDDAEYLVNAIKLFRNVISVKKNVSDDFSNHVAEERVRREIGAKLWDIMYPKIDGDT